MQRNGFPKSEGNVEAISFADCYSSGLLRVRWILLQLSFSLKKDPALIFIESVCLSNLLPPFTCSLITSLSQIRATKLCLLDLPSLRVLVLFKLGKHRTPQSKTDQTPS